MKWRPLKLGDVAAAAIAIVFSALCLYGAVTSKWSLYPAPYHANFGPNWDCSSRGSMCIRIPPVNSTNKAAP